MEANALELLPVAYGSGARYPGCEDAPGALLALGLEAALRRNGRAVELAETLHPAPGERWHSLAALLRRHAENVERSMRRGHLPVVIGGDHSIAAGTWRGVGSALHEAPGLIWIDAHLDAHTPVTTPSNNPHGMPLAALFGHGAEEMAGVPGPELDPTRVVLIGLRSWEEEEHALLQRLGAHLYDMNTIAHHGLSTVMRHALEIARGPGGGHFGISLDMDAIDPDEAAAVGTPAAHGIYAAELQCVLRGLACAPGLCALELVEYNPLLDVADRTGHLAIELLAAPFARNTYQAKH